jgi:hypothetical protein
VNDDSIARLVLNSKGDADMSILKSLKLAAAAPVPATSAEHGFRAKLLRYLTEQKALAEAEIGNMPFNATKKVTRTNEAGEKVRV